MKLYYSPGACSLSDHIAMHEADMTFDRVRVDLSSKLTDAGKNYLDINPKGYVPALEFDDGEILTENAAVLSWIAEQKPALGPSGDLGHYRLIEMLAFISTEIHKQFGRVFKPTSDAEATAAREKLTQRFDLISKMLKGSYLFGDQFSVADAYLFTMLLWAKKIGLTVPDRLTAFVELMRSRPAVQLALKHEGLE